MVTDLNAEKKYQIFKDFWFLFFTATNVIRITEFELNKYIYRTGTRANSF